MDVDLKQMLMYVQMCVKELGATVSSLERKIDGSTHSLSSIEQQLLHMKQQQVFAKMDKVSTTRKTYTYTPRLKPNKTIDFITYTMVVLACV